MRDGFVLARQKGSHRTFVKDGPDGRRIVTLLAAPTVKRVLVPSILKQAGWSRNDLLKRL